MLVVYLSYWTNRRDMAMKKRKRCYLVIYEILRVRWYWTIKAVCDKCEITAYAGRCDLGTAYITKLSRNHTLACRTRAWCQIHRTLRTPLNFHAKHAKVVKVLFELGGDVLLSQTIIETQFFITLHPDTYQTRSCSSSKWVDPMLGIIYEANTTRGRRYHAEEIDIENARKSC